MGLYKKVAAFTSIILFVLIYGLLCWPTVGFIRFFGWLFRSPEPTIRSRVANCAHWWGHVVFSLICKLLRIGIEVTLDGDRELVQNQPSIIISNHQSTLDVAVMVVIMKTLGQSNVRWVLKEKLRHGSLVIGWIAERTGCAFVSRSKDPKDLEEIRRCAKIMREDNAAIILFPEGTRFSKTKTSNGFQHVLPPKKKGFIALREALPEAPIVTVTLRWDPPVSDGVQGKTIYQGADFFGKTLHISIRLVSPEEVGTRWLETEWRKKDNLMKAYRRFSPNKRNAA